MATMGEAEQVRREREPWLLSQPGVTGLDLRSSDAGPLFRVYVRSRSQLPAELQGLEDIDGIPVEFVERTFEAH